MCAGAFSCPRVCHCQAETSVSTKMNCSYVGQITPDMMKVSNISCIDFTLSLNDAGFYHICSCNPVFAELWVTYINRAVRILGFFGGKKCWIFSFF